MREERKQRLAELVAWAAQHEVQPETFGVLFEHWMDQGERHAFGTHFTSRADIMKVVGPTIVEPWREQIERAASVGRLRELLDRMRDFTVLDPACGSGNFLYVAYHEMKRLESRIFERIAERSKRTDPAQRPFGFVTAGNFYGIDINAFAVELAKLTMRIACKLALDELRLRERAPAIENLDANFTAGDALIDESGNPRAWPPADAIIGNPPFLGAKRLKPERGPDYVNALWKLYPQVPGMADYCVYWFRKAHDHLRPCTLENPLTGRAGLVGTQNVRNNQSRVGGLDHVVKTGTIVEAVDNQPWSGDANVHVSIVNWVKSQDPKLLPARRRLWHRIDPSLPLPESASESGGRPATSTPRIRCSGPTDKSFELAYRDCDTINSALSDETDVSVKRPLRCNTIPKRCFQGKIPGYRGFVLDAATARRMLPECAQVVAPYLTGRELLGDFRIRRWVLDFRSQDLPEASGYRAAFEHCRRHVLPAVRRKCTEAAESNPEMENARKEHLDRWWQFWNRRDELTAALGGLSRYLGCSRVTRRPVMAFLSSRICPSDLIQVFAFDDDYSFGILQSSLHFEWFRTSSRLKIESDLRYSVRSVFDTFPWPQSPTAKQVKAVAQAGREVRRVRDGALKKIRGGLRAVYRTLELPGKSALKDAHAALDAAVLAAYGFSPKKDLLSQLLALNLEVARRIDAGQEVTAPGIPSGYPDPSALVTDDCIRAER